LEDVFMETQVRIPRHLRVPVSVAVKLLQTHGGRAFKECEPEVLQGHLESHAAVEFLTDLFEHRKTIPAREVLDLAEWVQIEKGALISATADAGITRRGRTEGQVLDDDDAWDEVWECKDE
jgi:hypothetical protein